MEETNSSSSVHSDTRTSDEDNHEDEDISETGNEGENGASEGDYYGVAKLSHDFDALLAAMTQRVAHLSDATLASVESKHKYVLKHEMLEADKQIAAMRKVLRLCDELEQEFLKIRQIGEIAADFRKRLTVIEKSL